ncbi:hypothetical protein K474DRAFT_1751763 [Panus rudis PR-1116 ss-1]|nr:hypothetical protein K474DRAFT_1751763 [Panus rudis PR-1116 ss-1]
MAPSSSTASLPMSASSSVTNIPIAPRVAGLKRPPSMQSMALRNEALASVTQLAITLTSVPAANRPKFLPYESLVHSAFLVPFLSPRGNTDVDSEQGTAVQTFEFFTKVWPAPTPEEEMDRCIWCCKAASVPTRHRQRIMSNLSNLLFSKEPAVAINTPLALRTIVQNLFALYADLNASPVYAQDAANVANWIAEIRQGRCGPLLPDAVEKEYGMRYSKSESDDLIREAIVAESAVRCLEVGSERIRRWFLHNIMDEYWPIPEPQLSLTPLLVCIYWQKLKIFVHSALDLLSPASGESEYHDEDDQIIVQLFRSRILPEVEAMRTDDAAAIQRCVVRLMLELLCVHQTEEREYLLMHICDWYQNKPDWKKSIEASLAEIVKAGEWTVVMRLIPAFVKQMPDELQLPLVSHVLPLLTDRIINDPPQSALPALSEFLDAVSKAYPRVFYKPLFLCAAATKELTVQNHLLTLTALSKFLPDFWTRDVEMISVALLSDSATAKGKGTASSVPVWGKVRLGQCALLVELINHFQYVRQAKDMSLTVTTTKFATALESRLGILIAAMEQTKLVPEPQRALFCALFKEIRLLSRSLKPATWLSSVISWCQNWLPDENDPDKTVTVDEQDSVDVVFPKLHDVYLRVQDSTHDGKKRRTTMFSPTPHKNSVASLGATGDSNEKETSSQGKVAFLTYLSEVPRAPLLSLLVAVSGLLSPHDYSRLLPVVWDTCMEDEDARVIAPTCYLTMQCAEKNASQTMTYVENELTSSDATIRLRTIRRISKLSSWRFQILNQEVIFDRSFRRPFKLARPPILFVATDMGSSQYIPEDDADEWRDTHGNILPLELRKRLMEIGWTEEDRKVDPKTKWVRTPMSLLPSVQLDHLEGTSDNTTYESLSNSPSPSPSPGPSPQLTPVKGSNQDSSLGRSDSSISGRSRGVKRRPVFVTAFVSLFPRLATMVTDPDMSVASAALDLIFDFMRDDAALIARSVLTLLTGDEQSVFTAISTLRAFLHVKHVLPPAMAHFVLNHLTGYLKYAARYSESQTPLQTYAYSMPIVANLVTQVHNLSLREFRRAKLDILLIPTGSLWFPPNAPASLMLPQGLDDRHNPFDRLPSTLVWITFVRISQNRLFLNELKRNPQDVQVVRKNATRLELPTLEGQECPTPPTISELIPRKPEANQKPPSPADVTLRELSLTLSRSYLLLVKQVFQCFSRHLNDRNELAIWMDGISRILVSHGNDIGIVSHAMMALMTASTRFRRLFMSGGGYTTFMPAVMKAYVEGEHNPGIRGAIEYAVSRFFALHQESFVFQSLDVITPIASLSNVHEAWVAEGIYSLFSSLKSVLAPSVSEASGIYGMNRQYEKEALMLTAAEEVPQTFLASVRGEKNKDQRTIAVPVPEEYESRRLGMDNFIRLFLTVIAYDPTTQRAQRFLRLLRYLAPHLYNASGSARAVLRDGIVALCNVLLTKNAAKNKLNEAAHIQPADNFNVDTLDNENQAASSQSTRPNSSDLTAMRLDYLFLVIAFTTVHGSLSHSANQRIIELVKVLLKESRSSTDNVATFVKDFARTALIREAVPHPKPTVTFLADLVPVVSAYSPAVDFSGLYDVVGELADHTVLSHDRSFAKLAVTQFCRIGLDACELTAPEGLLFVLPLRTSLLNLLNKCVSMIGADVMAEVENRVPTHDFLAGVMLPFARKLHTAADIIADSQYSDSWRREAHSQAWVRLLTYILNVLRNVDQELKKLQKTPSLSGSTDPRKSQDSRNSKASTDFSPVMTFAMALQVLKIIIVRAENDISAAMPGIWAQMGILLKDALGDGDGSFATRLRSDGDRSGPPSLSLSPRLGSFSEQQGQSPLASRQQQSHLSALPSSISVHAASRRRALTPPRMIDYLAWSFIHWLWLRRNPLMLQMRIFVQERMAAIADDLANRERDREGVKSYGASATSSRSRRVSSVFSKPRRSFLGQSPGGGSAASSTTSTPRNSTIFSNSVSLPTFSDFGPSVTSSPQKNQTRRPGYMKLPSPINTSLSSQRRSSQEGNGPRIVHLGPVSPSAVLTSIPTSPGGTGLSKFPSSRTRDKSRKDVRTLAKQMVIISPLLVGATYRRIRLVQRLMGYARLVPLNAGGSMGSVEDSHSHSHDDGPDPDDELKAWTKKDAIDAVVQETQDLLDEFREGIYQSSEGLGDESVVLVDVDVDSGAGGHASSMDEYRGEADGGNSQFLSSRGLGVS